MNLNFFLNGKHYRIYNSLNNLTLQDILIYFNYQDQIFVIEYNQIICNKNNWITQKIQNADKIEIISIVGGG